MKNIDKTIEADYILIGAGIMSATLGAFLRHLKPDSKIVMLERLHGIALESSSAWNNAGTGHAGMCELNYTPEKGDGTIDCTKAFQINEQFEISKQFWSWLVTNDFIPNDFIAPIPHMSLVQGEKDIEFLEKRYHTLIQNPLHHTMKFAKDKETLKKWIPLIMEGRSESDEIAATRMDEGADVNFGLLTRYLIKYLKNHTKFSLFSGCEVQDINKQNEHWEVIAKDLKTNEGILLKGNFVFVGAGGMALTLLQKSGIPEGEGYGGFPVSGQWLRCNNREVIEQHHAKVYGKAKVGAPPMSVPHLDTRKINGKTELLFGPFAGFSTKFLKHGSYLDLPESLKLKNIIPMIRAGVSNYKLTTYLVEQVMQHPEDRLAALKEFYPNAKTEDWTLAIAGQRVQIIKKDKEKGGVLEFGTEIVHSADGSLAALLGASPGASTSVYIILNVLKSCFKDLIEQPETADKIREMIPSFGQSLIKDGVLAMKLRKQSHKILGLDFQE